MRGGDVSSTRRFFELRLNAFGFESVIAISKACLAHPFSELSELRCSCAQRTLSAGESAHLKKLNTNTRKSETY